MTLMRLFFYFNQGSLPFQPASRNFVTFLPWMEFRGIDNPFLFLHPSVLAKSQHENGNYGQDQIGKITKRAFGIPAFRQSERRGVRLQMSALFSFYVGHLALINLFDRRKFRVKHQWYNKSEEIVLRACQIWWVGSKNDFFWERGWRSEERNCLPPMWPGFDFLLREVFGYDGFAFTS